jgi:nitroreductase
LVECLEAARLSPSACNSQPWRFIVVDDPVLIKRLTDEALSGLYAMNYFCRDAGAIVAIISEISRFWAEVGALLRDTKYYLIDIGIAGEQFVLRAEELGLGTCWLGWFDENKVKCILDVPDRKKIDVMLAIGYYESGKAIRKRQRQPLQAIATFNTWDKDWR